MTPMITDDQKRQYREDGYFLLENVFPPAEMDRVAALIEAA